MLILWGIVIYVIPQSGLIYQPIIICIYQDSNYCTLYYNQIGDTFLSVFSEIWSKVTCVEFYFFWSSISTKHLFRSSNITDGISRRTCSSIQLMTLSCDLCTVFGLTLLAPTGCWDWQVTSMCYILQGKSKEALFDFGRIAVHIVDTLIRFTIKTLLTLQFCA